MTCVWGGAEMGEFLPAVALGTGRSAVAVSAGFGHTCVLLVRCGLKGSGSGMMMMRWNGRGGGDMIPTQLKAVAKCCETPRRVFKGAWTARLCFPPATRMRSLAREASFTCSSPGRLRRRPAFPIAEIRESGERRSFEERP